MFVTISRSEVNVSKYTGRPKRYILSGGVVLGVTADVARRMVADGAAKYSTPDEIRLVRTPVASPARGDAKKRARAASDEQDN